MKLPRLVVVPTVFATVVGVIAMTYPGGVSAACKDFRDYRRNTSEMAAARERNDELADHSLSLFERINAKQAIILELTDGRLELGEAAQQFYTLTASDAQSLNIIRSRYEGSTDLERYARNVIDHVYCDSSRTHGHSIIARLDRQFRDRFGHSR